MRTPIRLIALQVRIGWYSYRKKLGYPITWRRALFGQYPRFGVFEEDEPGCPAHDLRDYAIVRQPENA